MRVLLPTDDDENRARKATETVISLPDAANAVEVMIFNVEQQVEGADDQGAHVSSESWFDEDDYPDAVLTAEDRFNEVGVAVEKRRVHGEPAEEILTAADEISADRIVMCGRKKTPVGKVLFGSVTQSVLLNAETPVTVIYG